MAGSCRARARSPLAPARAQSHTQTCDHADVLTRILAYGLSRLSCVQQQTIPLILQDRAYDQHIIVPSCPGTGKVVAYAISALTLLEHERQGRARSREEEAKQTITIQEASAGACQVLCMTPTRELALQAQGVMSRLSVGMSPQVQVVPCFGDAAAALRDKGAHIVVGTPDDIHQLNVNDELHLRAVNLAVLDGAEHMLSDKQQQSKIYSICSALPERVRLAVFAEVVTPHMLEFSRVVMQNPRQTAGNSIEVLLKKTDQVFVPVKQGRLLLVATVTNLCASLPPHLNPRFSPICQRRKLTNCLLSSRSRERTRP